MIDTMIIFHSVFGKVLGFSSRVSKCAYKVFLHTVHVHYFLPGKKKGVRRDNILCWQEMGGEDQTQNTESV